MKEIINFFTSDPGVILFTLMFIMMGVVYIIGTIVEKYEKKKTPKHSRFKYPRRKLKDGWWELY